MAEQSAIGAFVLRIAVGLIFLVAGFGKLMNPAMPTGMLEGLGFPMAAMFAWVLIIVEIGGGAMLLLGWNVQYASIPLAIILVVATITVFIPQLGGDNPMAMMDVLWHVIGIGALISLYLTGPGAYALQKE
ncbi:MAG: DoxX family protein [Candidatus Woesearchaeota archaeon]